MVGVDLAAQHVAKKKGFRDTICLARLSGWGDSLFFSWILCCLRVSHGAPDIAELLLKASELFFLSTSFLSS